MKRKPTNNQRNDRQVEIKIWRYKYITHVEKDRQLHILGHIFLRTPEFDVFLQSLCKCYQQWITSTKNLKHNKLHKSMPNTFKLFAPSSPGDPEKDLGSCSGNFLPFLPASTITFLNFRPYPLPYSYLKLSSLSLSLPRRGEYSSSFVISVEFLIKVEKKGQI